MKMSMNISNRLSLLFLLVGVLPLALFSYFNLQEDEATLRKVVLDNMSSLADKKAIQVKSYLREREREVRIRVRDPQVMESIGSISKAYAAGRSNAAYAREDAKLHQHFERYIEETGLFYDAFLITPQGEIVYTQKHESDFATNLQDGPWRGSQLAHAFQNVRMTLEPVISGYEHYAPSQAPAMFIAAPIMVDGQFKGVFAVQLGNELFYKVATDATGLGQSGEAAFARQDGDGVLFTTPLKQQSDAALKFRVGRQETKETPMFSAVSGESGAGVRQDYRGKSVVAAWRYLPELDWGMVVKVDADEVFASIHQQRILMLETVLGLLLLAGLAAYYFGRQISVPLKGLAQIVGEVAKGDLNKRADESAPGELSLFAQAFNRMTGNLQASYQNLEKLVEQRTGELKKSESMLDSLISNMPAMVFVKRASDLSFIRLNRAGEKLLGFSEHELLGKNDYDFFPREQADFFVANDREVLASHQLKDIPQEPIHTRSGEEKILHTLKVGIYNEAGEPTYLLGVSVDITEHILAEKALARSQRLLNEAQHTAQIGSWELDLATGTLNWSDEIFHIFEIDKGRFGATYEAFLNAIHPDDRDAVNHAYTHSLETLAPYEITHRLRMSDGRIKWVQERCSSDFDADNKPLRSVGTVQDISLLKQAQLALEQLNEELERRVEQRTELLLDAKEEAEAASRSKTIFLTSMSHELRTPLNAILGFSQLMQLDTGLPQQVLENAQEIRHAGDQLLALLNDVLDLSRIEFGHVDLQIKTVDLLETLTECHTSNGRLAAARNITIVEDDSCKLIKIRADSRRLLQALNHLVSNAIKFNRDGGKVTVSCAAAANGRVRIFVTDTGRGIPAASQSQLFQPFNRLGMEMSAIEGTGIGLAIIRRLVEAMDGVVGVDSVEGTGSTFWMELPTPESAVSHAKSEPVRHQTMPDKLTRVLVAEDYAPNQNVLRMQLQALGCEVEIVANGAEALKKYRGARYDLILTDLNMPIMDGPALAKAIREEEAINGGHIAIVAITAAAVPSELKRCLDAGMDDTLTKPVALEGLRTILARWLGVATAPTAHDKMDAPVNEYSANEYSAILSLSHLYRTLGQVDFAQASSLVATFISAAGEGLAQLESQISDALAVSREMHKQKSSARTVGAMRYAQLAESLEQEIRDGKTTGFPASLAALRIALTEVENAAANLHLYKATDVAPAVEYAAVNCHSALIVDDDPVVLQQMTSLLTTLGVAELLIAKNGREAIQVLAARDGKVELLVCDLNMPEMDGVELIREFGRTGFDGGLILISGADEKVLSTVSRLAELHGLRVLGQLRKPVIPAQIAALLAHFAELPRQFRQALVAPEVSPEAIREAMARNQFSIWFQPKVDSASLRAVGVEALARWKLPDGRFVPPDIFITVAEQSGLIGKLSQLLLATALSEAAKLFAAGYPLKISVNLSGLWLDDLNLPDFILTQTLAAKLEVTDVILEVTETGVMEDLTTALDVLTRLRIKGFGLSIDDFGIGYSSFEQLGRIPFTEMKLDRSFVNKGAHDPASLAILEGSMDMARKLGLSTVAEGVETEAELELIRSLGCGQVQGYFIAKAMPLDDLLAWMRTRQLN